MSFNGGSVDVAIRVTGAAAAVAELEAVRAAMGSINGANGASGGGAAGAVLGMQQMSAASQALHGNIMGAAQGFAAFGAAGVGVAAVGAALAVASVEAAKFQQQMANLQAVLHAPSDQIAAVGQAIQQSSRDTIFTATQIAEADTVLAKAGADANGIIRQQADVLNLASATNSRAKDAAVAYTTAQKDFNLTSRDSTQIADDLSKAVDSSVGTLADFQDGLKQVGPVALQAGLDLKTTTVALADLMNAGLQGDSGTALKIFLQRLEAPTAQAKQAMADLGLQVYDTDGKMKSLADIADQLRLKTAGLSEEQKNLDLTKIFGARGIRVADVFAEQGSSGMQDIIDHENNLGSAAEIAQTKLATLSGQMHQLSSSANVVGVNIGSVLVPALTAAAQEGTDFLNSLGKITSGLSDLDGASKVGADIQNQINAITGGRSTRAEQDLSAETKRNALLQERATLEKQAADLKVQADSEKGDILGHLLGGDTAQAQLDQVNRGLATVNQQIKSLSPDNIAARGIADLTAKEADLVNEVARGRVTMGEAETQARNFGTALIANGVDARRVNDSLQDFYKTLSRPVEQQSAKERKAAYDVELAYLKDMGKAFDDANKAAGSVDLAKGLDGLVAKLPALKDARDQLAAFGQDTGALANLIAIGDQFQAMAQSASVLSQQFTGFQASISHTQGYISEIDKIKKEYADTEQYIKNKPLFARTDADLQFLKQYPQFLASLNNEADKLQESNVGKLLDMSKVIPDFASFNQAFDAEVKKLGGPGALQVQIALDIDDVKARTKVQNLIKMVTSDAPAVDIAVRMSGDADAQIALDKLDGKIKGIPTDKEITALARVLGLSDVQSLALLIDGLHDRTVAVNVVTGGGLPDLVTTPGIDPTRGYASGTSGAESGWAWVGEKGPELVRFRGGETVLDAERSRRMNGVNRGYDSGTIDIGNADDTSGPYTATNPGPSADLAKGAAAARGHLNAATGAANNLKTATEGVTRALIDASDQAKTLSGYLASLDAENLRRVTAQFDQQYNLLSKIAINNLGPKATQEQRDAAQNQAALQALNVTISMAAALQQAKDPANDLAAAFQAIRDTGTPIAENLIRQVSIIREINIANAQVKADQEAITALDQAHAAQKQRDAENDKIASRQRIEDGWVRQEQQRREQAAFTLRTNALEDRRVRQEKINTDQSRADEDTTRHLTLQQTLAKNILADKITAAEDAAKGITNTARTLAIGLGATAATGNFQAAEQLAIVKETQRIANENLAVQRDHLAKAQVAQDRLFAQQQYDLETLKLAHQRSAQDELLAIQAASTALNRAHTAQQEREALLAQRQQIADTRHQWAVEDIRARDEAVYTAQKAAAQDQLKVDQEHAKALTDQLQQAQDIEALWEKVYPLAGDTANALLTAFASLKTDAGLIAQAAKSAQAAQDAANSPTGGLPDGTIAPHATGGVITTPYALVGERGPELIRAPGYSVTPAGQTAAMLGGKGGDTYNLTFNASGNRATDDETFRRLQRWVEDRDRQRYSQPAAVGGRR